MIRRLVFAAALAAGCSVATPPDSEEASDQRASALALPLESLDTTAVKLPTSTTLSSASLAFDPRTAFSTQNVVTRLTPGETFALRTKTRGTEATSAGWSYFLDGPKGFLLLDHLPSGFPVGPSMASKDDTRLASLVEDARQRLALLGVASSEIAYVVGKAVMREDRSKEGVALQRSVVEYKIFAARAFGGVAVDGGKGVLTYSTDGRLTNVLARWPRLAATGHVLSTTLSVTQIASRVAETLGSDSFVVSAAQKEKVRVRLVYVATPLADGTVTLALHAEAAVNPAHDGPSLAAPRVYHIKL